MTDVQLTTQNLQPLIALVAEGEEYDAATGRSVGVAKYIIAFPRGGHVIGLEHKVIGTPQQPTRYEVRFTRLAKDSESVMRELYTEKS